MAAKILVVEDNSANLELMCYLLKAHGYETVEARDGQAGIETAMGERPDLVVCDLQLPVVDGFTVVRRIRERPELSAVPVLAVTAFAMVGDREKVMGAGFDGYIAKPIAPESFADQVAAFLPASLRSELAS